MLDRYTYMYIQITSSHWSYGLIVERNLKHADTTVCSCGSKFVCADPLNGKQSTRTNVLERDILERLIHAPNIGVCVQGGRRDVFSVGCPSQGIDSRGVVCPASGDCLEIKRLDEPVS